MNCQEIARTLDSRDVNRLSAAERSACEAHASACLECGPTWAVYTRLAAIPVPVMSQDLATRCEALAMARGRVTPIRRVPLRVVLFGAIVVVAAAAAMLSLQLVDRQLPVVAAAAALASTSESGEDPGALGAPVQAVGEPAVTEEKAGSIDDAIAHFTVQVLELRNEVQHPAGRNAVAAVYAAFLDRLRAVPGVTLLAAEPTAAGTQMVNYRITITGEDGAGGIDGDHKFGGRFQTEILLPSGNPRGSTYRSYLVEVAPGCVTNLRTDGLEAGARVCSDPDGVAAQLLGSLRKSEFPPDPALRRELQARLLDRSLDILQRQQALSDLVNFGSGYRGRKAITEPNQNLADPVVIRGALDLATTSSDPKVRAMVWTLLRGTGNASLVPPMLAALEGDADSEVRLAALVALAGEFASDARVQAALTSAAKKDTRPLVRALASRAAGGPDAEVRWKQYVVASLKDSSRSSVERTEALLHQMNMGSTSNRFGSEFSTVAPTLELLDDEAVRMLAVMLPDVAGQSSRMQVAAYTLLSHIGQSDRPAVTELLLDLLDGGTTVLSRKNTTELLGERAKALNDTRAYAMLEKLSAGDPDPGVREVATAAVKARPSAPLAGRPQRLGVNLSVMQADADVAEDMVGRPMVVGVGTGTVAQRAGVMNGDVLLEIDGMPVPGGAEIIKFVESLPAGVDVDVLVQRSGQKVRLVARF